VPVGGERGQLVVIAYESELLTPSGRAIRGNRPLPLITRCR
jgi:hypothetical protein